MKRNRIKALAAAVLFCAGLFSGCAKEQGGGQSGSSPTPQSTLRNDGREAKLVLGGLEMSEERMAVIQEIAEKYQADFPQTEIEVRAFQTPGDMEEALKAGELDLAEVSWETQPAYVQSGLLLDISPYLAEWSENVTLTAAARAAVGSMGAGCAYLIPTTLTQDMLFYRKDWFDEYNEGREDGFVRARVWDEVAESPASEGSKEGVPGKLGERGRLVFAGRDRLVDYFDAMVWSTVNIGRMADISAAYFSGEDESKSIFTHEKASEGADQFLRVMKVAALPETLDWTEEQAIDAFVEGRAAMLLADRSAAAVLEERMPEGAWIAAAYPRGRAGLAVFAEKFSGWGISSSAEDPEIAAHFLTFFCGADNNTHYAKVTGTLPIHLSAADMEPELSEGSLAAEMEMIGRSDWYQYAFEPVMYKAYSGYREQADEKLRQYISGELTQDGLMDFLDDYWSGAYAEEGRLWN